MNLCTFFLFLFLILSPKYLLLLELELTGMETSVKCILVVDDQYVDLLRDKLLIIESNEIGICYTGKKYMQCSKK